MTIEHTPFWLAKFHSISMLFISGCHRDNIPRLDYARVYLATKNYPWYKQFGRRKLHIDLELQEHA